MFWEKHNAVPLSIKTEFTCPHYWFYRPRLTTSRAVRATSNTLDKVACGTLKPDSSRETAAAVL